MKAALGGVAAAAVWQAPRIEGLSIAPDVAQAATCFPPAPAAASHTSETQIPFASNCWGNSDFGICGIQVLNLGTAPFTASATIGAGTWGPVPGSNNAAINVNVAGLNTTTRRCTVALAGTGCGSGRSFFASPSSVTFGPNTTGTFAAQTWGCNLVPVGANPTITLTLTCSC